MWNLYKTVEVFYSQKEIFLPDGPYNYISQPSLGFSLHVYLLLVFSKSLKDSGVRIAACLGYILFW